jgi:restriction system protein
MTEAGKSDSKLDDMREIQLQIVAGLLLEPPGQIAVLHGAPGAGKTRLAHRFATQYDNHFPDGVTFITGPHGVSEALLNERPPTGHTLLVIDEADRIPLPSLKKLIDRIVDERPLASVLMTSNTFMKVSPDTISLEMPPLSRSQIVTLLAEQADISSPRQLKRLMNLLAGNATAVEEASRRLAAGMPPERLVEWLESGRLTIARDSKGRALSEGSPERSRLDVAVNEISEALIEELAERPQLLYDLDPRKFEKLIAELYRRRGFEATLTPASGDEGVDIYVVSRNDLGQTLWVVQAKRHAAENRIEAGVVRELFGTVAAKEASAGILVTTSFFQPGAIKLEREFEYRLSLKDYMDLQEMLRWPRT